MRSLRLSVFLAAFSLLAGSFTAAAVRADEGRDGPDKVESRSKGKAKDRDRSRSDDRAKDDEADGGDAPKTEAAPVAPPVELPEKPGDPASVALPSEPVLGQTAVARTQDGDVQIKLPGSDDFAPLDGAQTIPMGSTLDASHGLVEIVVAAPDGTRQNAVVTGSIFAIDQFVPAPGQLPVTDMVLKGGDFSSCAKGGDDGDDDGAPTARAAARKRTKGGVVRGIWAAAKGHFRTRGRHSAATVRGTRWATVDRCRSTTTKVLEGVVDVADFELNRVFTVRAGERHVAREQSGR